MVHDLFHVCSSHTMFTLQRTRIQNMQFAAYTCDTPVTLRQSQGHQTLNDNVDPKQAYNHAKFEKSCFHGVREKANVKVFCCFFQPREYVNYLLEHVLKSKTVEYS